MKRSVECEWQKHRENRPVFQWMDCSAGGADSSISCVRSDRVDCSEARDADLVYERPLGDELHGAQRCEKASSDDKAPDEYFQPGARGDAVMSYQEHSCPRKQRQ
jgi:hypothetical protein